MRDDESKAKQPTPGIHSNDVEQNINTQRLPGDVKMTDPQAQVLQSSVSTVDPATSSVPAAETLSPAMDDEVNRVLHTLTGSASMAKLIPDPKITEVTIAEAVDPGAVNSDQAMPLVSHDIDRPVSDERGPSQTPVPGATGLDNMEGIEDMDVDTPLPRAVDATSREVERDGLVTESPIYTPAYFQAIIENMVNDVNRHIADTTAPPRSSSSEVLPTPPVTDQKSPEPGSGEFPIIDVANPPTSEGVHLEDITPSTKTGIAAATVIARHRGLASGTITITLSISQDQLDLITKWNDRSKHSDDLGQSLCITLLCFAVADVQARLESSQSNDLCTLLPELECSWPETGGLSMNALWNGQRIKFPLSPPFANGLVDMTPFLVLGNNTFRITQTRDMSKYWLLLCAHRPTSIQLTAVARQRHKEKNWESWLEKTSQPLQLPFVIPIEV
ncbi:hypothetical protein B0H19DRAFT_255521 [Mycena capillaripes]|nr:hypothetical protein B0H19DRAFT_255521 [Mycena capillaripes]